MFSRKITWFDAALRLPARQLPELRGIDAPLRSLPDAARAVYLARKLEAAERSRVIRSDYEEALERIACQRAAVPFGWRIAD